MKWIWLPIVVLSAALVSLQYCEAAETQLPLTCQHAIDVRLPGWQLAQPPEDLAAYARQNGLTTNIVQGDFDDDGAQDTAALVLVAADPRSRQHIAVCLADDNEETAYFIDYPYCGDGIAVASKGTRAFNHETGDELTYPVDGVSAYCFEKAGATYLFEQGAFIRIIDSD